MLPCCDWGSRFVLSAYARACLSQDPAEMLAQGRAFSEHGRDCIEINEVPRLPSFRNRTQMSLPVAKVIFAHAQATQHTNQHLHGHLLVGQAMSAARLDGGTGSQLGSQPSVHCLQDLLGTCVLCTPAHVFGRSRLRVAQQVRKDYQLGDPEHVSSPGVQRREEPMNADGTTRRQQKMSRKQGV